MIFFSITSLLAVIDINNATSDELLKLNGIGKAKSQKIIAYRDINQCFKTIDELASIDGISEKIVSSNRAILTLGICKKSTDSTNVYRSNFVDVLLDPVNMAFVLIIFILGLLDQITGKDLKSQIVSIGVLGTFVGIFIGLQGFNPNDIVNSVNDILLGLKTAFFTSIVGMSVSTILSIIQKFKVKIEN
ncbi:helix-hairpin-helix domain-containing protein [Sulfurimonas sp.]